MPRSLPLLVLLALLTAGDSLAQPDPIPAPPIPDAPQLGAAPPVNLPPMTRQSPPVINIPDAPVLTPVPIPPAAAVTPAAKNDPVPPPLSGIKTGPPAATSPGANDDRIEEVLLTADPGASQVPASAIDKLRRIAEEMQQDKASRLEVRVYSPVKAHSESTARRLSLARFLAIRDMLAQSGVPENRVDGRALSSTPSEPNADRVELYLER